VIKEFMRETCGTWKEKIRGRDKNRWKDRFEGNQGLLKEGGYMREKRNSSWPIIMRGIRGRSAYVGHRYSTVCAREYGTQGSREFITV
jgi:hypothetical protein